MFYFSVIGKYSSYFNFNPLSAKFIKWSNILIQIVGKLPTICLRVFDHFSGLSLKGLKILISFIFEQLVKQIGACQYYYCDNTDFRKTKTLKLRGVKVARGLHG